PHLTRPGPGRSRAVYAGRAPSRAVEAAWGGPSAGLGQGVCWAFGPAVGVGGPNVAGCAGGVPGCRPVAPQGGGAVAPAPRRAAAAWYGGRCGGGGVRGRWGAPPHRTWSRAVWGCTRRDALAEPVGGPVVGWCRRRGPVVLTGLDGLRRRR